VPGSRAGIPGIILKSGEKIAAASAMSISIIFVEIWRQRHTSGSVAEIFSARYWAPFHPLLEGRGEMGRLDRVTGFIRLDALPQSAKHLLDLITGVGREVTLS
jgi:hypothetical protein